MGNALARYVLSLHSDSVRRYCQGTIGLFLCHLAKAIRASLPPALKDPGGANSSLQILRLPGGQEGRVMSVADPPLPAEG